MSMTLHIEDDNKTYEIVEWQHKFYKEVDSLGRSITKPIFTEFIIKLNPAHMPELVAWAAAPYLLKKRVYIIEDPTQSTGRLITTEFVDVKCTTYEITMEGIFLEFAAAGYCREHVTHTAYWKESLFKHEENPNLTEREVEEETEPVVVNSHYEDENGEKIEELELGKVTLVVEVEGGEGELMDLDLADDEFDFRYKGKRLENDLLEGITVTSGGIIRVELEVIPEDDAEGERVRRMGGAIPNPSTDERPSLKTPKSIIDVPKVPNKKIDGIIRPNVPKLPELSEDALKNIPENMQKVITDYPDDVLPDAMDEGMRQDIIIAATNPKDIDLQEKGISAGQALLGKAITAVAIAGTAYGLYKSGKQMVEQIESAGKFLKKIF